MSITTRYKRITLDNGAIIEIPEQTGLPEVPVASDSSDSLDARLKRIEDRLALLAQRDGVL